MSRDLSAVLLYGILLAMILRGINASVFRYPTLGTCDTILLRNL